MAANNRMSLDDYFDTLSYHQVFDALEMPPNADLSHLYYVVMSAKDAEGLPPYKCLQCDKSYQEWERLMNHQFKRHNIDLRTRVECKLCNREDPHPIILADFRIHANIECNSPAAQVAYNAALMDNSKAIVVGDRSIMIQEREYGQQKIIFELNNATSQDTEVNGYH